MQYVLRPKEIYSPSASQRATHTFTTQAVIIGNAKDKAESGVKQEGEGETEPLADEEVKASGRAEGTDQPMEYIVPFAKAVKLCQQKTRSCFGWGSPDHLMWDCPKDISKSAWKAELNAKEGMAKKGG